MAPRVPRIMASEAALADGVEAILRSESWDSITVKVAHAARHELAHGKLVRPCRPYPAHT